MIFLAIILGLLPGLIWAFFYLQEDIHPEPRQAIVTAFIIGSLITIPTIIIEVSAQDILDLLKVKNVIISIIVLALIEELFKFSAALWATHNNPEFDEPIDAMIYVIIAALGFATIENILTIENVFSTATAFPLTASLKMAFSTISLRFIGATLLHALTSGLMGYYWAKKIIHKSPFYLIYGLLLAGLVHSFFNYLILKFQSINFLVPSLFLILGAIFVMIDFEKLRKMI